MSEQLDLMIIGGGPAGMAAALVAGRARLSTVVVNAEAPRNRVSLASHGFLTRDGAHADELLEVSRQQLQKYPAVRYVTGRVASVRRVEGGFLVKGDDGQRWQARRLVLATGYRDELSRLGLPGVRAVYGRSLFPCPFCDGFEHADERLAVFGGEGVQHFAKVVRVWSQDVAVFTNGRALSAEALQVLETGGVPVYPQAVRELLARDGVLTGVALEDGRVVARDSGFIGDDFSSPATGFAAELGVSLGANDWGMSVFEAQEDGSTGVPGLYMVGDARSGFGGLMAAAYQGSLCASHIVHEVAGERWGGRA